MRNFSPIYLFRILLLVEGSFFLSCAKESCDKIPDPVVLVQFLTVNDAGRVVSAGLDDASVWGAGTDSLLYDNADNLNGVYLPLSPVYDTSVYVIKAGSIADTMAFVYSRNLVFVSIDCGYTVTYDLEKIASTGNLIDSIWITNPNIRILDSTNVFIYF